MKQLASIRFDLNWLKKNHYCPEDATLEYIEVDYPSEDFEIVFMTEDEKYIFEKTDEDNCVRLL